jgi:Ca-activated chloride channel family protein
MEFAWPAMLWSLVALPLLVAAYAGWVWRRRRLARRQAPLRLLAEAMHGRSAWRHAPAVLLFVAIAALLLSAARPTAVLPLPSHHETVILAIDVSHSMRAEDVAPNRLVAAQEAAKSFVDAQRRGTRIGVVAFSSEAALVQAPTTDREALWRAIESLQTQDATAIGAAIIVALQALFPSADLDPDAVRRRDTLFTAPAAAAAQAPGSFTSGAIILLTDGQNTAGPDAAEAAQLAADRGVRVYTVGFGTASGATVGGPGWSVHVQLDEGLLRGIADTTWAEYLHAQTAPELKKVYASLSSSLTLEGRATELGAFLCAAAALAALLAGAISLVSFRRVA